MVQVSTSSIRQARIRNGYTLASLAERCTEAKAPITESQMSRIERGHSIPRPALRKVLADLLDLDDADFQQVAS